MATNYAVLNNIKIKETSYTEYFLKNGSIFLALIFFIGSVLTGFFYTKIPLIFSLMVMLGSLNILMLSIFSLLENEKKEVEEFFVENKPGNNYFLNFGTLIHKHTNGGAVTDLKDPKNIIGPLLINEEWTRRHIDLPGTTGSGKTVAVKSYIQQIIREIGSGFIMVEGKGANDMKHEIYAEVVMAKRSNDFFILDFMNPNLSNTLNPLEFGDHIEISDFFMDMLKNGKESDNWAENSQSLFSSVLTTLLYLRDGDCVWDPKYSKEINTVADIEKYQSKASILVLKEILLTPYSVIDFAQAIQRIYENDFYIFTKRLSKKNEIIKRNIKLDNSKENHVFIHQALIDEILKQTKEIPNFDYLMEKGIETIMKDSSDSSQLMYVMEVSLNQYSIVFGTFIKEFGSIFAVDNGDINLKDIINNGKILYVILQGINPTKASLVGKFMLSLIRMAAKERGTKKGLLFPFPIFLDEFNSWSKGIEGFPDLMSVTRSLGFTFFLMHQSELSKIDDGKGLESSQARANMNITILLKTEDEKIAEEIIKKLGKITKITKNIKMDFGGKDGDGGVHDTYNIEKEEPFSAADVSALKPGQAFLIVGGKAYPMVTSFIADNTVYEIDDELPIPINKIIPKDYEKIQMVKERLEKQNSKTNEQIA